MRFSYFSFESEHVMDGKFGGTSFEKARSPLKSYPSDDSIQPEQTKLDSEIDSNENPNPSIEIEGEGGGEG